MEANAITRKREVLVAWGATFHHREALKAERFCYVPEEKCWYHRLPDDEAEARREVQRLKAFLSKLRLGSYKEDGRRFGVV